MLFRSGGEIDDFPGNYSEYRAWQALRNKEEQERQSASKEKDDKPARTNTWRGEQVRKLTYKEKKEMEQLEVEIAALESEQTELETLLCSGSLSAEELNTKSKRLYLLKEELDEKSMRWLELSCI